MSSEQAPLRKVDQAIQEARRHLLLLHDHEREQKRARGLRLKRMVLYREVLAKNPVLLTVIQPEVLRARLSP